MKYDHGKRRDKLRRTLAKRGLDGLLVSHRPNVRYLTGFRGDDSLLLVTRDGDVLLSDERFRQEIEEVCGDIDAEIRGPGKTTWQLAAETIQAGKLGQVAVEGNSLPVAQFQSLAEKLPHTSLQSTTGLVESFRQVKDRAEIAAIRHSIRIAEKSFSVIKAALTESQSEQEIAWEIESLIRRYGGEGCSFPPIVAVGRRAALPHALPGPRMIGESPFLLVDWGATFDEYCSDLTRMIVADKIPPKFARTYEVVLRAQLAAIKRIKPGVLLQDVDRAARQVIEQAGLGKRFTHGLGHGIGLEIHESPRIAAKQDRPLRPGMVVTIEPGVYVPSWGGIRIEDDILVTRGGHEVLTSLPTGLEDSLIHSIGQI